MLKHRGFPSKMTGADVQFTIRREAKDGATPLKARERYRDRRPADRMADATFLAALIDHFGEDPFMRGNLDAGRLNFLLGREVVPADEPFDPASYDALLRVDLAAVRAGFPDLLDEDGSR